MAAYRVAPDGPAGEAVAAQARVSLLATADRAQSLGALLQAIEALTSALEVTRDPGDHAHLLERTGVVMGLASRYDEGQQKLAAAVEAYEALDDRVGVIRTVARRIQGYLSAAQIASATEVARPFRDAAERFADGDGVLGTGSRPDANEAAEAAAMITEAIGRTAFRSHDMAESVAWSDRAIALAEPLRLDEIVAMALVTKASALLFGGHRREGLALLEGAVLDARAHGQDLAALRGANNLSSAMVESDPRASLERTREGMVLSRRLGLSAFDTYHAGNAAAAAERLGEWAWLAMTLDEVVERDPDRPDVEWITMHRDLPTAWTGDPDLARAERLLERGIRENDIQAELIVSDWLACCEFAAGRPAAALDRAESFFRDAESGATVPQAFAVVGRFALHAGRLDVAQRVLGYTVGRFGGVLDHDVSNLQAGIAALEGRTADALGLYRSALAGYREAGCPNSTWPSRSWTWRSSSALMRRPCERRSRKAARSSRAWVPACWWSSSIG